MMVDPYHPRYRLLILCFVMATKTDLMHRKHTSKPIVDRLLDSSNRKARR